MSGFVNDRINSSPFFFLFFPPRFFTGRNKTKFLINPMDNGPIPILPFIHVKNRNVVSTLLIRIQRQINEIKILILNSYSLITRSIIRKFEISIKPNNDPSSDEIRLLQYQHRVQSNSFKVGNRGGFNNNKLQRA